MHAVVVRVNVGSFEQSREALRTQVVPRVSQLPGFVAGYWTAPTGGGAGGRGLSMLIFESADAAQAAADAVRQAPPPTVTIEDVEVREVVAHA